MREIGWLLPYWGMSAAEMTQAPTRVEMPKDSINCPLALWHIYLHRKHPWTWVPSHRSVLLQGRPPCNTQGEGLPPPPSWIEHCSLQAGCLWELQVDQSHPLPYLHHLWSLWTLILIVGESWVCCIVKHLKFVQAHRRIGCIQMQGDSCAGGGACQSCIFLSNKDNEAWRWVWRWRKDGKGKARWRKSRKVKERWEGEGKTGRQRKDEKAKERWEGKGKTRRQRKDRKVKERQEGKGKTEDGWHVALGLEGNHIALKSRASTCWRISSSVPWHYFR